MISIGRPVLGSLLGLVGDIGVLAGLMGPLVGDIGCLMMVKWGGGLYIFLLTLFIKDFSIASTILDFESLD
jgi:hypothetical protein